MCSSVSVSVCYVVVFFFKQKTAYEMRISDWSSYVCSSDLPRHVVPQATFLDRDIRPDPRHQVPLADNFVRARGQRSENVECAGAHFYRDGVPGDRKSVV